MDDPRVVCQRDYKINVFKDGTRINPSNSLLDRIIVTLTGKPRGILPYIAFMSKVYSGDYVKTAVRIA